MTDDEVLEVVAEETGAVDGIPRWRFFALETTIVVLDAMAMFAAYMAAGTVVLLSFDITPRDYIYKLLIPSSLLALVVLHYLGRPTRRIANTIWLTESERYVHNYESISRPTPHECPLTSTFTMRKVFNHLR